MMPRAPILYIAVSWLVGCGTTESNTLHADSCANSTLAVSSTIETSSVHRPQALLYVDDLLVVSNTAYDGGDWGDGAIVVIDTSRNEIVNEWKTASKNPQTLVVHDGFLYVVNTGTFDLSNFENPEVSEPGSVERVPIAELANVNLVPEVFELPNQSEKNGNNFRAPIDLAFVGPQALITSALDPSVYVTMFTHDAGQLVGQVRQYGVDTALGLGAVTTWNSHFIVIDFNSDTLFLMDPAAAETLCQVDLGLFEGELEGAMSPLVVGDRLYVIMALSGMVREVDLVQLEANCSSMVDTLVSPLGQIPNDMLLIDERLTIVESGDNRVRQYAIEPSDEACQWTLPVGSNPWSAAFDARTRSLAISEWGTNSILLINTQAESNAATRFGSPAL